MNRNKKLTKRVAVAVAGAMITQTGALPVYAEGQNIISKEETVYVKADAAGEAEEVIVSDWLKNSDGAASLSDSSDLENIENVKGEETFSQDGKKLTWEANGQDIYYQGTTKKELPVGVEAVYYLDGQEISPEELAGKSGHVKIRYTYRNTAKSGDVYTPFTMVTGMILPSENFRNVTIDHGKVISDGEKEIVIGIGLPGMAESLKLKDTEALKDIDIPDSFELEADVTDFSLTLAMTVASPLDLEELGIDEIEGMDDLKDSLDELTDAATQLVDGSGELADGVQTLKDSCVDLIDGMNTIDENMGTLADGISTLNSKKGDLIDGIDALVSGIQTLESKKGTLVDGVGELALGATTLREGVGTVKSGSQQLAKSSKQLQAGAKELATGEGSQQLQAGSKSLVSGSQQLQAGSQQLADGITALVESQESQQLLAGSQQLADGSKTLETGVNAYTTQVACAAQGMGEYVAGVEQYVAGVNQFLEMVSGSITGNGSSTGTGSGTVSSGVGTGSSTEVITGMESVSPSRVAQASGQISDAAVVSEEQIVRNTINDEAIANVQTVLATLQGVQGAISNAKTPEDLKKLMGSYNYYVGQLEQSINLLNGTLGGIQEETINTVTLEQVVETPAAYAALESQNTQEAAPGQNTGAGAGMTGAAADTGASAQMTAAIEQLKASGTQLQSGGEQITNGLAALNTPDETTGMTVAEQLNAGAKQLTNGAAALNGGISQVFGLAKTQLKPGADAVAAGIGSLTTGAAALDGGLTQLFDGAGTLEDGLEKFAVATAQLSGGTSELYTGAKKLEAGAGQLNSGAAVLSAGIGQLAEGGSRLESGAGELGDGIQQLADGSSQLKAGTSQLAEGGQELNNGVAELKDGADELRDGMEEFNEEGIEKITDFLEGDIQDVLDRLEAVQDAGEAYKLFSESGNVNGRVKFIIETAGIE